MSTDAAASLFATFGRQLTPVVFALAPALLAYLIYAGCRKFGVPQFRWVSLVPLAVGVFLGITALNLLNDPLYTSLTMFGTTLRIAFIAVLVVPVVTTIALFVLDRFVTGGRVQGDL